MLPKSPDLDPETDIFTGLDTNRLRPRLWLIHHAWTWILTNSSNSDADKFTKLGPRYKFTRLGSIHWQIHQTYTQTLSNSLVPDSNTDKFTRVTRPSLFQSDLILTQKIDTQVLP